MIRMKTELSEKIKGKLSEFRKLPETENISLTAFEIYEIISEDAIRPIYEELKSISAFTKNLKLKELDDGERLAAQSALLDFIVHHLANIENMHE